MNRLPCMVIWRRSHLARMLFKRSSKHLVRKQLILLSTTLWELPHDLSPTFLSGLWFHGFPELTTHLLREREHSTTILSQFLWRILIGCFTQTSAGRTYSCKQLFPTFRHLVDALSPSVVLFPKTARFMVIFIPGQRELWIALALVGQSNWVRKGLLRIWSLQAQSQQTWSHQRAIHWRRSSGSSNTSREMERPRRWQKR